MGAACLELVGRERQLYLLLLLLWPAFFLVNEDLGEFILMHPQLFLLLHVGLEASSCSSFLDLGKDRGGIEGFD